MKSFLGFLIAGVIFLSGCAIQQEVSFNEDWSGTYSIKLDMSSMQDMMKGLEEMETGESEENEDGEEKEDSWSEMENGMKEMVSYYETMEGISNVKYISDPENKAVFTIQYDFDDITALNAAMTDNMAAMGGQSSGGDMGQAFSKKGKKFSYVVSSGKDEQPDENMEDMGAVAMMSSFETRVNFPVQIKKLKGGKGFSLENDNQTLLFSGTLKDMMDAEEGLKADLKLSKK